MKLRKCNAQNKPPFDGGANKAKKRHVRKRTSHRRGFGYFPLIETDAMRGETMMTIFKTFLAATALALTLGLTTATVSAPAMADGFDTCGATPSGTC